MKNKKNFLKATTTESHGQKKIKTSELTLTANIDSDLLKSGFENIFSKPLLFAWPFVDYLLLSLFFCGCHAGATGNTAYRYSVPPGDRCITSFRVTSLKQLSLAEFSGE